MNNNLIDKLNLGLIIISLGLACLLPFELFLVSYAILGPLHYLTESNWIKDKGFFVSNKSWKYIVFIAALVYSIPRLSTLSFIQNTLSQYNLQQFFVQIHPYTNILVFLMIFLAAILVLTQSINMIISGIFVSGLISYFSYSDDWYIILNGMLIPTLIHVYIFTILFMIYGTRKKPNKIGMINIVLMVCIPILLCFLNTDIFNYRFSDFVKAIYLENNFHAVNARLSNLFGLYEDLKFFFYEKVDLRIQIFIAFAYIYHYLNWFSKTSIIGWHTKLDTKKSIIIISIWLLLVISYAIDYKMGFIFTLFFSILHVMLEFPLNIITIKSLVSKNTP